MAAIEKDIVIKRINGIQNDASELIKLGKNPFEEFSTGQEYKLAEYHLRHALEGVFKISSHILSRIPGAQATTYKEIALKLGEFGIIDRKFSEDTLVKMANYRNRIVHFYAEITAKELYGIIHNNLGDFDIFLKAIKDVLEHPEKFGLTVE